MGRQYDIMRRDIIWKIPHSRMLLLQSGVSGRLGIVLRWLWNNKLQTAVWITQSRPLFFRKQRAGRACLHDHPANAAKARSEPFEQRATGRSGFRKIKIL